MVEADACDTGIGAILQQQGHPIAFMSKALCPKLRELSMIVAVDQWRPYLQQNEFVIQTDQKSLVHLEEQRLTTPWQQKAFTKLLGPRYTVKYKKGSDNNASDSVSCNTYRGASHDLCVLA